MSRVHDMGGRFGDGPVIPEPEDEVFHEDWHGRALALTILAGRVTRANIDMGRHARESLSPQDYMRFSYYEKWLAALADQLVEHGVVTRDELSGAPPRPSDLTDRKADVDAMIDAIARGSPADRSSDIAPCFVPGDVVRTRRRTGNRFQ